MKATEMTPEMRKQTMQDMERLIDKQVCQIENLNKRIKDLLIAEKAFHEILDNLIQERTRVDRLRRSRDRYKDVIREVI
jgi:hypothetical protein